MKKTLLVILLLSCIVSADQYALTQDGRTIHIKNDGSWRYTGDLNIVEFTQNKSGKKVVLYSDNTWQYVTYEKENISRAAEDDITSLINIPEKKTVQPKPSEEELREFKSVTGAFSIFYNPLIWKMEKDTDSYLQLKEIEAYFYYIGTSNYIGVYAIDTNRDVFFEISKYLEEEYGGMKSVDEELRTVNGKDVNVYRFVFRKNSTDLYFLAASFRSAKKNIVICSIADEIMIRAHRQKFIDFFKGLYIHDE